jgi:hypothetical protein
MANRHWSRYNAREKAHISDLHAKIKWNIESCRNQVGGMFRDMMCSLVVPSTSDDRFYERLKELSEAWSWWYAIGIEIYGCYGHWNECQVIKCRNRLDPPRPNGPYYGDNPPIPPMISLCTVHRPIHDMFRLPKDLMEQVLSINLRTLIPKLNNVVLTCPCLPEGKITKQVTDALYHNDWLELVEIFKNDATFVQPMAEQLRPLLEINPTNEYDGYECHNCHALLSRGNPHFWKWWEHSDSWK